MTGTTSASGNTKSAIVDAAAGVLREAGAGAPDGTTPVAALGPALLGAWPEDSGGPEVAARAMVDLITGSDPAAKGLVRGLLAAAPAPLTQLARISRLTSLERALAGRAGDLEPAACRRRLDELVPATEGDDGARLTALQEKVTGWTADLVAGRQLNEADTAGLAGLVRLEATARLARAEGVAGNLDGQDGAAPGRRRLLARWTEASHDLDRLAAGLVGGDLEDPRAVRSRLAVAIGPEAMAALVAGAASWSGGQRLARLLKQLAQPELRVEDPAAAFDRMLAVVAAQGDRPLLAADPDPLLLGVFIVERGRGSWLKLDLPGERLVHALRQGFEPPPGVAVVGETLHVACTPVNAPLPQEPTRVRAAAADDEKDESQAARKQLVLTNISTISVLLEFLRDAKITSIPGLVEEIVNRTRNPQVLETIATNRKLCTGFANRNVPLALLRSPVNVSVRTIRRFIHVKFVSKMELKRLAADKAGLRKEVHREIEKYLATLV